MPKRSRSSAKGAGVAPPLSAGDIEEQRKEEGDIFDDDDVDETGSEFSGSASAGRPAKAARLSRPCATSLSKEGSGNKVSPAESIQVGTCEDCILICYSTAPLAIQSLDPVTTRKLARKERNRLSAASSRARKREEDNELRARLEAQEIHLATLSNENVELKAENLVLKEKVSGMDKLENELESIRERFQKLEQMLMSGGMVNMISSSTTPVVRVQQVLGEPATTSTTMDGSASGGGNQEVGSETHATGMHSFACFNGSRPLVRSSPSSSMTKSCPSSTALPSTKRSFAPPQAQPRTQSASLHPSYPSLRYQQHRSTTPTTSSMKSSLLPHLSSSVLPTRMSISTRQREAPACLQTWMRYLAHLSRNSSRISHTPTRLRSLTQQQQQCRNRKFRMQVLSPRFSMDIKV